MPKRATPKAKAKPKAKAQLDLPGLRQTPREQLLDQIKAYRQKVAIAGACYQKADEMLAEIAAKCPPGKRIPVGDGLYAVIVDLFAETDKYFKPVAVKRYELQIQDSTGRAVRMRDRKKAKR